MKLQDLKNAVENIEISETMQQEIARNVTRRIKNRGGGQGISRASARRRVRYVPRIAAVAAAFILAVGIVSIPVRALVSSLVKERMEEIPNEEHEAMVEMLDSQPVGADTYTRELTEDEQRRQKELWGQYRQGLFPESELPQTDSEAEAQKLELCYLTTDSSFHLPDRELTDEELLELIDFEVKRNYALQQRYEEEFADKIEAEEQEREEAAKQAVDAGGITEEEAVESAKGWMQRLYGITGDDMERNSYFEATQDAGYAGSGEKDTYMVNWSNMPGREYYYFYISAQDSSLVYASYSSGDLAESLQTPVTPEEAETKLPELKTQAEAFMRDKLGLDAAAYGERYALYMLYSPMEEAAQPEEEPAQQTIGSRVGFLFYSDDGQPEYGYVVTYAWDGTFLECCRVKDIDTYWDNRDMMAQAYQKNHGEKVQPVKKRLDEIK